MSDSSYIGLAVTPALTRVVRDPQRGLSTATYYKGTPAQIATLKEGVMSDQRWETTETGDGMVELVITTPDVSEAPYDQQDTWELLNNRTEKDLYEHPKAKALTEGEITAIKSYLKFLPRGQDLPVTGDPGSEVNITGDALTLFKLLLKGTNKYTTGEYVLRYSVTCSTRSSVTASFSNVEKLFTTTQLNTPGTSGITIPTGIGFSIASITAKTEPTGYLWSWLKIAPTVRTAPQGKIVISQEWWLDLWSTFIYTAVT